MSKRRLVIIISVILGLGLFILLVSWIGKFTDDYRGQNSEIITTPAE